MPGRRWTYLWAVFAALIPVLFAEGAQSTVCPRAIAAGTRLVDGTPFDPNHPDHALAAPLLALRALWLDGALKTDGPWTHVDWNGHLLHVGVVQNTCTGGLSPVGERCEDLEFIVRNVENSRYVSFHAFHPMVVALQGDLDVWFDLYRHSLNRDDLEAVFGPSQDFGNK